VRTLSETLRHRSTCQRRPLFITERHVPHRPSATFTGDDKQSDSSELRTRFLSFNLPLRQTPCSPPSTNSDVTRRYHNLLSLQKLRVRPQHCVMIIYFSFNTMSIPLCRRLGTVTVELLWCVQTFTVKSHTIFDILWTVHRDIFA
jgi:hypothetical protein